MSLSIVAWCLAAPFALAISGANAQVDSLDAESATALEHALTERACLAVPSAAAADADARQRCMDAQLSLLRNDFGRDLRRLPARERIGLDGVCSRFETTHGREAYLDCVNAQLVALRVKRNRAEANGATSPAGAVTDATAANGSNGAAQTDAAPENAQLQPAASRVAHRSTRSTAWRSTLAIAIVLAAIAASATAFAASRKRGGERRCRQCAGAVADSGDLCAACRHGAAETMRRAAMERLDQVRSEEADRRRKTLEAEEHRQQLVREEDARQREQEEMQRRAENARRIREEQARRQSALAVAQSARESRSSTLEEFDPYAVLGVPRDTPRDQIRAAYEQARSKYDEDIVSHLGVDVQEHFREKARAIDRAYHILAG